MILAGGGFVEVFDDCSDKLALKCPSTDNICTMHLPSHRPGRFDRPVRR